MGDGRSISTEGKIGIFLALIGLLGAGAIMIAPQQLWIGWSLIAIAVIGLIILGFYHFWGRSFVGRSAGNSDSSRRFLGLCTRRLLWPNALLRGCGGAVRASPIILAIRRVNSADTLASALTRKPIIWNVMQITKIHFCDLGQLWWSRTAKHESPGRLRPNRRSQNDLLLSTKKVRCGMLNGIDPDTRAFSQGRD
jgi:hypothetical protein